MMNINVALEKLNTNYANITAKVKNLYLFSDKGGSNDIDDGGNDIFDNGNYLSTADGETFPYTHTQQTLGGEGEVVPYENPPMDGIVQDSPFPDTSGQYFTNMYPGLFTFVVTNPKKIIITGNMGSDDGETVTSSDNDKISDDSDPPIITGKGFTITHKGKIYTVYTRYNRDTEHLSDPTTHHLIIVPGSNNNWIHTFTSGGNDNYNDTVDLSYKRPSIAYYFLFATRSDYNGEESGGLAPVTNILEIVTAILDALYTTTVKTLNPTYTFEVVSYQSKDLLGNLPGPRTDIELQLANRAVWIEGVPNALKHGDTFTMSGKQAVYTKETYVDVPDDSPRKLLKIID